MARRGEGGLLELLSELPWWVSVCVSATVFVVMRFVVPPVLSRAPLLAAIAPTAGLFAWPLAGILLLPAVISALSSIRKRKLLDRQQGIETIRALSWKEFEELLGEAYRRQGFSVTENRHGGADGGIDLTIQRGDEVYLVQCKQWRAQRVGVKVVREMLGLVTAHGATGAIVVTSGAFTPDAEKFALGAAVELVGGPELVQIVSTVQYGRAPSRATSVAEALGPVPSLGTTPAKACPKCGGAMVLREAKRGPHAGDKFMGCANYPRCRYIENLGPSAGLR